MSSSRWRSEPQLQNSQSWNRRNVETKTNINQILGASPLREDDKSYLKPTNAAHDDASTILAPSRHGSLDKADIHHQHHNNQYPSMGSQQFKGKIKPKTSSGTMKSSDTLQDSKTRYSKSIEKLYEVRERARQQTKDAIWESDLRLGARVVRSETDLVNEKFEAEFPRTSLYIRDLQLNGLSFLKSKLDVGFSKFSTKLVHKFAKNSGDVFPMVAEYLQDYTSSIKAYLQSDFFRKREILIDRFAMDFGTLEEENALLKDVLAHGEAAGKPIEVLIKQAVGGVRQARSGPLNTASKSTSAPEEPVSVQIAVAAEVGPPKPKKRGVKFAAEDSFEDDAKTKPQPMPTTNSSVQTEYFGVEVQVQSEAPVVADVGIQVEVPNKEIARLKEALDNLNKLHAKTVSRHEEDVASLQSNSKRIEESFTHSLEHRRCRILGLEADLADSQQQLREQHLSFESRLSESRQVWEEERKMYLETQSAFATEKENMRAQGGEELIAAMENVEELQARIATMESPSRSPSVPASVEQPNQHDATRHPITEGNQPNHTQTVCVESNTVQLDMTTRKSAFDQPTRKTKVAPRSSKAVPTSNNQATPENVTVTATDTRIGSNSPTLIPKDFVIIPQLDAKVQEERSLREAAEQRIAHLEMEIERLTFESQKSITEHFEQSQTFKAQYQGVLELLNVEKQEWNAERSEMQYSLNQYQTYVKELEDQVRALIQGDGDKEPEFSLSDEYDQYLRDKTSSNTLKIGLFEQENNRLRNLRLQRTNMVAANTSDDDLTTAPTSRSQSAKSRTNGLLAAGVEEYKRQRVLTKTQQLELDARYVAANERAPAFAELAPPPIQHSQTRRIGEPVVLLLPSHHLPIDSTSFPYEELRKYAIPRAAEKQHLAVRSAIDDEFRRIRPGTGGTTRSSVRWADTSNDDDNESSWSKSRPVSASTFGPSSSRAASATPYRDPSMYRESSRNKVLLTDVMNNGNGTLLLSRRAQSAGTNRNTSRKAWS
ncbi:hypothetical protein SmJEL517_g03521 [Synchytrium microbalum]|uniref:Uncharacterized protein n=1 Tax=Synchytrium microbalum TaxID=1806994 RepID=A0A507BXT3_9FUNG|nr:uncharacterized protein SmJEL517_g03521 [Synchytrium microbalum]TPX33597.1 hypothetical protein SmJEL517_g03521 [Synchytrium microbalum]